MTDMEIHESANLIFQPSEALSQRVIDAEKKVTEAEHERDQIRKGRSRAQLMAIIAFVALATSIFMGLAGFAYANSQIAANKAEAAQQISDAQANAREANARADGLDNEINLIRAEHKEFQRYRNVANLEIQLEQVKEKLQRNIELHRNPAYAVPNQEEIFARTPAPWTFEEPLNSSVWITEVTQRLETDIAAYDQIFLDLDTARAIADVDPPQLANCVRKNPFDPNPVQNC